MPSSQSANFGKLFQVSVMTNNVMEKVSAVTEANSQLLVKIEKNTLDTSSAVTKIEALLQTQNKILAQIAANTSNSGRDKGQRVPGLGGVSLKEMALGGLALGAGVFAAIVGLAGAITLSAKIFGMIDTSDDLGAYMARFAIALATVGTLYLAAGPFTEIIKVLSSIKASTSAKFDGASISSGNADIMGMVGTVGSGAIAMVGMSAAIAMSSWVLMLTNPFIGEMIPRLGVAILTALALVPIAHSFVQVLDVISKMKGSANVGFEGMEFGKSGGDVGGMLGAVGGATLAIIGMAIGVTMASRIFMLISEDLTPQQILIAALVGLALVPIAYVYSAVLKALLPFGNNFVAIGVALAGATVAMPLMAFGLAMAIRVLNMTLPDRYPHLPSWDWIGKFGTLVIIGAGTFWLLSKVIKNMSLKDIAFTAIAMVAVAGGMALSMQVWNLLGPTKFNELPEFEYILKFQAMLFIGGLVAGVLGMIGLEKVALGALGMIVVTGAIALSLQAWKYLAPDDATSVAKNMADTAMQPFYAFADALAYFREKIPSLEVAAGIAGSLVLLSGAWVMWSAAMVGSGVAGAVNSVLGAVGAVFDSFTKWLTDEDQKDPLEVLLTLANNATKIKGLAQPMAQIANAFGAISKVSQPALVKAADFMKKLNEANFSNQARDFNKIAAAYGSIAKSSKAIKIDAIVATDNMLKSLTEVAKAGGTDTIEELKDMMVEVIEALADAAESMSGSSNSFVEGAKDMVGKLTGGAIGNDPNKPATNTTAPQTTGADNAELTTAIQELRRRLDGILYVDVQNIDNLRA